LGDAIGGIEIALLAFARPLGQALLPRFGIRTKRSGKALGGAWFSLLFEQAEHHFEYHPRMRIRTKQITTAKMHQSMMAPTDSKASLTDDLLDDGVTVHFVCDVGEALLSNLDCSQIARSSIKRGFERGEYPVDTGSNLSLCHLTLHCSNAPATLEAGK
jgi:hypothetical protein